MSEETHEEAEDKTPRVVPQLRTSVEIAELAAALATAQGEIEMAAKDSKNPHFNRTYADLASVWKACRPALAKHGLAVVQVITCGCLITRLIHKSGQWIEGDIRINLDGDKGRSQVQAFGSALTYLRRYALSAMVGVAPDDDDDGEGAREPSAPRERRAPYSKRPARDAIEDMEQPYANEGPAPAPKKPTSATFEARFGEAKTDDEVKAIARDIKAAKLNEADLSKLRGLRNDAEARIARAGLDELKKDVEDARANGAAVPEPGAL